MKKLFIASLFIVLSSCAANSTSTSTPSAEKASESSSTSISTNEVKSETVSPTLKDRVSNCTCVKMWMPVCGENKKTYGNSCEADCAGVKYTNGACKEKK